MYSLVKYFLTYHPSKLIYTFILPKAIQKQIKLYEPFSRTKNQKLVTAYLMSLKVTPQIFKWLQTLSLVKDGKRTNDLMELSQELSLKFFDGIHIAFILKNHFAHAIDQDTLKKIDNLKENSNPAIRLYNWNILTDVLKKIKAASLDSSEKSKLLTLQYEPLLKVLKALFEARQKPLQTQKKGLKVQINEINKKSLLEANNAMEFLIISLSKNFKLSPQHTLNLFIDNNKYLSHLLVKGVKNNFAPISDFLRQINSNIDFLASQIFCIDQEQNVQFFFNALKSCMISKDENTVWECLDVWIEIAVAYKMKGISVKYIKSWIKSEGINTLFFTLSKSSQYFSKIIELCYMYLEAQLFEFFQLNEKSLLWNSDKEKLTFFRRLISMESRQVVQKFISSPYIDDWLKHLIKISKKVKQSDELYDINIIYESLWLTMQDKFEDEKFSLASSYFQVIKQILSTKQFVNFFSTSMSLFNLIKVFGNKKNPYAPQLFKTAVTAFNNLSSTDQDKVVFFAQNLIQCIREIKNLPGGSLVSVIIKHLTSSPNPYLLQLCKVMLEEKRINEQETVEILQILTKIIFQDVFYSEMAAEIVFQFIPSMNDEVADEYLTSNSKLGLSNFVSQAKFITKTPKELKAQLQQEYKNFPEEDSSKTKSQLSSQLKRFLLLNNCLLFLNKYFEIDDINLRNSLQTILFHTYVKVKVELKKKKVADILLPLMKNYYEEDDELNNQIDDFQKQHYPEQDSKEYSSKITLLKSIKLGKSLDLSSIETSDFKTIDPSSLKPSEFALKDLEVLRQKRQHLKTIELQKQKQTIESQSKIKQIKNFMNQKRLIEFGSSGKADFDYKNLYQFDSMKEEEVISGVPLIRLVNFDREEESTYEDDLKNVMKKYRKVWRFLFFKYSTFGAKKQQFKTEQKINMAQIWKMLRQYEVFSFLKKQESQTIIKLINDNMKRKNDPQCLTYPGFEEYIAQVCSYAYGKSTHPHLPPGRQVLLFIEQLKRQTKQKGGSIELFDNPEDIYFQETEVIREYNRRLKQNPDYILPEGYKKYKQFSLDYEYSIHPMLQKNVRESYVDVYEVLHMIFFERLGINLIEPLSLKSELTLAKPVLFQTINQKLKDYKKGYLQPKATIEFKQEKTVELRKSIIMKKEFKPHINFSLGIKLGLSSVSIKNKSIGEQVAYWMHDMLNAIENQTLKVDNSAKKKVQNVIIKRRRVESLQKLKKQKSNKKDWKKRAQSVKVRLETQKKLKEQENNKKKQVQIQQKKKTRTRQEQSLKKKLSRFEQMKKVISERKEEAKYKKIEEDDKRKERLQEYKSKVQEYFQKKKQQILQKQEELKKQKEEKEKQEQQKQQKQSSFVKQLYLNNLKKQQDILQKADQLKQNYQELWESDQISQELLKYEKQLHYLFNLLLKYQKSKISATSFDQIGLNTLHYFALKFMVIPFMVQKTQLIKIFNFVIKEKQKRLDRQNQEKDIEEIQLTPGPAKAKSPGLNFKNFQQALLLIAIKAKKILNKIKEKRSKRMQKLLQFVKQKKAEGDDNHFDVQDMSESEQESEEDEQDEDQKAPGLLEEYLFNVQDVDEETLRQVFVFLKLPKDKLGVEERYRSVVESKNLKPKNILKVELKKQMETVKLEDLDKEQGSQNQG